MSHAQTSQTFNRLRSAVAEHRGGDLPADELAQTLRGETALLARLPPRYAEALEEILVRLESAALFSEESCSFSQRDLVEALEDWLTRAQQQMQAGGGDKTG
ncbi:MAG TPA: hypothetical protein VH105_02595 [Burkholderiales bacterium]|jgi:hypothetical protein|nr:hypothetical protein [Burkholderiales bacterium]